MSENMDPNYAGEDIYRENILDHYKHPHNKGRLDGADHVHTEDNPVCGDVITISLKISDGRVEAVKFDGRGCAISQAAASMLTDEIKGMSVDDVRQMTREDVADMLGITIGPVRTKCAVLSLVAVRNALGEKDGKV